MGILGDKLKQVVKNLAVNKAEAKSLDVLEKLKRKSLVDSLFDEPFANTLNTDDIQVITFVYLHNLTSKEQPPKSYILQTYYKPTITKQEAYNWYKAYAQLFTKLYGFGLHDKGNNVTQIPKKYVQNETVHEYLQNEINKTQEQNEGFEIATVLGSHYKQPTLYTNRRIQKVSKSINWDLHISKMHTPEYRQALYVWRKLVYIVAKNNWTIEGVYVSEKNRPSIWLLKPLVVPDSNLKYINRKKFMLTYPPAEIITGGIIIDRTRYLVPLFRVFLEQH